LSESLDIVNFEIAKLLLFHFKAKIFRWDGTNLIAAFIGHRPAVLDATI
jgi:hypothetical protein